MSASDSVPSVPASGTWDRRIQARTRPGEDGESPSRTLFPDNEPNTARNGSENPSGNVDYEVIDNEVDESRGQSSWARNWPPDNEASYYPGAGRLSLIHISEPTRPY